MSVTAAKAALTDALKELHLAWSRVRADWDDPAAERFEHEVLDPMEPKALAAAKAMDELAELISRVRRECADSDGVD